MVFAGLAWFGKLESYNLVPSQGMLFIAIAFTMVIMDLFTKYLMGKNKVLYVWIIEIIILAILCMMIIPRLTHEFYS
jgi:hypothetical protein